MSEHMSSTTIQHLQRVAQQLESSFVGKDETVRLMLIAAIAGEHMLLIGPPGTAKSALVRMFAKLVDAKYFEYLLTRFTEPNELFGPLDIQKFRDGHYERRVEGMLPEAEIVFLDEVFKANSAILNSLLGVLNERIYSVGSVAHRVPLISTFGASNEVPNDEDLMAVFDRFLIRVRSDNLDSYHFHELLLRGIDHEVRTMTDSQKGVSGVLSAQELRALQQSLALRMQFSSEFLSSYKSLIFQIRSEGITVSDRRAVKLLRLLAASATLDDRRSADASDFFVLRHIWNNLDQAEILDGIVSPVVDAWYRDHPEARRTGAASVGVDALITEMNRIRDLLTSNAAVSDVQLFSHMKALNEIKVALQRIGTPAAKQAVGQLDQLLGHVFQSGNFPR